MRRLILTLAAAVLAAGAPLGAELALAKDGGRWEARDDRGRGRDRDRGPPRREWRGDDRPRRYREDPPPQRFRAPPPQQRPRALRRGGFLPPEAAGPPVRDYGRHRLRPPPHGYGWYRVPGGYALVDLGTGQVLDVAPD